MEKIEIEMNIAARRSTVYEFLSDPAKLREWMGDVEISGGSLAVRYPNGDIARGSFVELIPDCKVVFTWGYENAANGMPPGSSTVTIELSDASSGTRLTFRHEGIPSVPARDAHYPGWLHYTSRLNNAAMAEHFSATAVSAIDAYFKAWSETDDTKRLAILQQCWEANATFCDAMGAAAGRDALSQYIGAALRYAPGAKLEPAGAHQRTREYIRFDWRIASGGTTFGSGTNFGKLTFQGKFESVVGFSNR